MEEKLYRVVIEGRMKKADFDEIVLDGFHDGFFYTVILLTGEEKSFNQSMIYTVTKTEIGPEEIK